MRRPSLTPTSEAVLSPRSIALLPWGFLFEDYLDPIGLSLETFCSKPSGGWLFGYADALREAGLEPVIFIVSARVQTPTRLTHMPSGVGIWVLPAPRLYRLIRRWMANPYSTSVRRTFNLRGTGYLLYPWLFLLKEVAPYIATPLRAFVRGLRREHCEVILCQEYESPRFDTCVAVGRNIKVPVFATFQGGTKQQGVLERYIRPRAIHRCAGLIIAPLLEQERVLSQYTVPQEHIARIFNPLSADNDHKYDRLEARARLDISPEAHVVVWHGRVERWTKGLDVLLAAWKHLCKQIIDPRLRLILIGSGREAEWLRKELSDPALDNVHWIDQFITDRSLLRLYLSAADLYAFPSRREGFPVAPLEALSCGLPVVATEADGIPDIFEAGEDDGGVVVPRDNPEEFAAALGRVLSDPQLRVRLASRARQRADSFSAETVGRELYAFIREASHLKAMQR